MYNFEGRLKSFANNRWLLFVASMRIQSCARIGYLFGSISPVIKSSMGYTKGRLHWLGAAKDLGDSVGFIAGNLCEILRRILLGMGLVWLFVTGILPCLPLWVCISLMHFSKHLLDHLDWLLEAKQESTPTAACCHRNSLVKWARRNSSVNPCFARNPAGENDLCQKCFGG